MDSAKDTLSFLKTGYKRRGREIVHFSEILDSDLFC